MPVEGALSAARTDPSALIEVMGWTPDRGLVRGEAHLRRMAYSAAMLGFPFEGEAVRGAIAAALSRAGVDGDVLRVRLTLSREGVAHAEATPFTPPDRRTLWRVIVSPSRVSSRDPMLRHKTDRRALFESERARARAEGADEVLFCNERGDLTEGSVSNLFLKGGETLRTPPLSCGLLPGILRACLLREGRALEESFTPARLGQGVFYVGNSLRGLIRASRM